jgi:hypothetical protein
MSAVPWRALAYFAVNAIDVVGPATRIGHAW